MALTLIPEDGTGKADANSYASVADADAYHEAHLYAARWTAATTPTKEMALAMATRTLDASTSWKGERKTSAQALAWPRTGILMDGHEVADDTIPKALKDATAELARLLIIENLTTDVAQNDLEGLNLGKGALQLSFRSTSKKRAIPTIVGQLLMGLGIIGGGSFRVQSVSR